MPRTRTTRPTDGTGAHSITTTISHPDGTTAVQERPADRDGWCARPYREIGAHDALAHLFEDYCPRCGWLDGRED